MNCFVLSFVFVVVVVSHIFTTPVRCSRICVVYAKKERYVYHRKKKKKKKKKTRERQRQKK